MFDCDCLGPVAEVAAAMTTHFEGGCDFASIRDSSVHWRLDLAVTNSELLQITLTRDNARLLQQVVEPNDNGSPYWSQWQIERTTRACIVEFCRSIDQLHVALSEFEALCGELYVALDERDELRRELKVARIEVDDLRLKLDACMASIRSGRISIVLQEAKGLRAWLVAIALAVSGGAAGGAAQAAFTPAQEVPAVTPHAQACAQWIDNYDI